MRLGDLKNDFLFRRIFARHPELTADLLNDLLGRAGEARIVELTLLTPEQAPEVLGAKLSILDVKCRDQAGRFFVVEMQMLHVRGFLNRVVYNACKAYVGQLPQGGDYQRLADVVALSLCDFILWPDDERRLQGLAPVPLVSSWSMRERSSGAEALSQVQYAFVELPKVSLEGPLSTAAEQWAWLFRVGAREDTIPPQLSAAQKRVLELSNEALFTDPEREAYRKVNDEIWQARQLAFDAEARGIALVEARGLREAVRDLREVLGLVLDAQQEAALAALDLPGLEALRARLKRERRWS